MATSAEFQNTLVKILDSPYDRETKFTMINLNCEMEVLRSAMTQAANDAKKNNEIIDGIYNP